MNLLDNISTTLIIAFIGGILFVVIGICISKYPREGRFLTIDNGITIESLINNKLFKSITYIFTRNKDSKIYRLTERIIRSSEANISVEVLYLLKIISVVLITSLVILVRYTNIDIEKTTVISHMEENNLFEESTSKTYIYNLSLYRAIVKNIGEKHLQEIDDSNKVEEVRRVIPELINSNNPEVINSKAHKFVKTFNVVSSIKLLNLKIVLVIIFAFWLPEILLILKRLLLSNMYKKEVIKLENIFELLGSVKDFKTISILSEMSNCSKTYNKHLRNCIEMFHVDKKLALDYLKLSVKNKRFSRLVEIIRTYSLIDKQLAVQILVRNRMEKEEQILLTAQEDIDIIDIIAFISITPVLYYLVSLLLKPMMDMVFEAFKYI